MDWIITFFTTFWHLSEAIGFYLLIGLVFVGIAHLYVSETWIQKHLGASSRFAALKGALYGIPLPLCSCGVIPLATSLRKKGASKKAVTSFFITTPMTGVDSIIATYGVFGLPMALIRVVSSFISGVMAGVLVDDNDASADEKTSTCNTKNCDCHNEQNVETSPFKKALDYALNEVFADIAKPMIYGLLLATLFVVLLPAQSMQQLSDNLLLSYILVLLISLPMYVCSISAIPIALGLLAIGATPGTAFIFLAAAPATNIITAGIIKQILGLRSLLIYMASIVATTLLFAYAIDTAMPVAWFDAIGIHAHEDSSLLQSGAAVIFLLMASQAFFRGFRVK